VVAVTLKKWKSSDNNTTGTTTKIPPETIIRFLKGVAPIEKLAVLYTPGERQTEIQMLELRKMEAPYRIKIVPIILSKDEDAIRILPKVVDSVDAIYLTGYVPGPFPGFAVTANALQSQCGRKLALGDNRDCDDDAFLVILNAGGSVTYASYLGGQGSDKGTGIAVDADGSVIVTGNTFSPDFSTTPGALMTTCHVEALTEACYYDTFVTKFAPDGTSIDWSTYLASDEAGVLDFSSGIAADAQGNIYVTGYTAGTHFPVQNAVQNQLSLGNCSGFFTRFCFDVYLTVFDADGALIHSTYLGGTGDEYTGGLAVDAQRNVYMTGYSYSAHFPTTPGVIQPQAGPGAEFFVAKIGAASGGGGGSSHTVYLPVIIR
jgi:hypothetical protein